MAFDLAGDVGKNGLESLIAGIVDIKPQRYKILFEYVCRIAHLFLLVKFAPSVIAPLVFGLYGRHDVIIHKVREGVRPIKYMVLLPRPGHHWGIAEFIYFDAAEGVKSLRLLPKSFSASEAKKSWMLKDSAWPVSASRSIVSTSFALITPL